MPVQEDVLSQSTGPETLSESIREMLFDRLRTDGEAVTEESLACSFGVSRTPIREALKGLERDGIILRKKRQGIFLRRPSVQEIVEVYDIRSALEGLAGRIIAASARKEETAELEAIEGKLAACRAGEKWDTVADAELEVQFHRKMVEITGNGTLLKVVDDLHLFSKAFRLYNRIFSPAHPSVMPHKKILEAIRSGDPQKCEEACRAHVQRAKEYLIRNALGIGPDPYGADDD